MSNFDSPQEPQQNDVAFALFVLLSCGLLCAWPSAMKWLLGRLEWYSQN